HRAWQRPRDPRMAQVLQAGGQRRKARRLGDRAYLGQAGRRRALPEVPPALSSHELAATERDAFILLVAVLAGDGGGDGETCARQDRDRGERDRPRRVATR